MTNRGKQFETIVKESFEKCYNTSIIRLHDQTSGFRGSANICDFIVYHYPYMYPIECKSIHGNTLPFSNITDKQYKGMLEVSKTFGVLAGVLCWWVDKDVTAFIPIHEIAMCKDNGYKSIRFDHIPFFEDGFIKIPGKKKRVFFDYDMNKLFEREW